MQIQNECQKLIRYLLNTSALPAVVEKYQIAHKNIAFTFSPAEEKLWHFALKNNFSMGIVDAGLAILNPFSVIRKKYTLLFAF